MQTSGYFQSPLSFMALTMVTVGRAVVCCFDLVRHFLRFCTFFDSVLQIFQSFVDLRWQATFIKASGCMHLALEIMRNTMVIFDTHVLANLDLGGPFLNFFQLSKAL